MNKKKLINAAIATAITMGLGSVAMTSYAAKVDKMEKCYGISDVGKNDCGTATHSCAGQSKVKNDPNEWELVAKGTCVKLGGSLTAGGKKAAEAKKPEKTAEKSVEQTKA